MAWLRTSVVAVWVAVLVGCGKDAADPTPIPDVTGVYPLASVNGHAVGWAHNRGDGCQVVFTSAGVLTLQDSSRFDLRLPFDYRCLQGNGTVGSSVLVVRGGYLNTGTKVAMTGLVSSIFLDEYHWQLEATPELPTMTLRFMGLQAYLWGDPVIGLGPRGRLPASP